MGKGSVAIDSSVILSILLRESHEAWCTNQLALYGPRLLLSAVNLTEILIVLQHRFPAHWEECYRTMLHAPIHIVPTSQQHAELAAMSHAKYPLNLGDGFAYALAKERLCPLLTLDSDFLKTDLEVIHPSR